MDSYFYDRWIFQISAAEFLNRMHRISGPRDNDVFMMGCDVAERLSFHWNRAANRLSIFIVDVGNKILQHLATKLTCPGSHLDKKETGLRPRGIQKRNGSVDCGFPAKVSVVVLEV